MSSASAAPKRAAASEDATARYLDARQSLPTMTLPDPSTLSEEERRALRGMVIYDRVEPPTAEEIAAGASASEDPGKVAPVGVASSGTAATKTSTTWEELAKRRGAAKRR
jgi:hypothetical protein